MASFSKTRAKKRFDYRIWLNINTRDPLTVMLLVLQGISLCTTVEGAKIIFPAEQVFPIPIISIPVYMALGLTIQMLIVVLLIFGAAKRAPIRKTIAVLALTFFSTYTSFFSIYNGITGGALDERSFNGNALDRHGTLQAEIYTPYRNQLNVYEERRETLERRKQAEIDGSGRTGVPTCGPVCKGIELEIQELVDSFNPEIRFVENEPLVDAFGVDALNEEKDALDIYRSDQAAIASAPYFATEKIDKSEYEQSDYETTTSYFLIPYRKVVKERDIDAKVSLIIASSIDGFSLLLGSIHVPVSIFRIVAAFFVSIYLGIKRVAASIYEIRTKEAEPFENLSEANSLRDAISTITIHGKASKFLEELYFAVDCQTGAVNYSRLLRETGTNSYRVGYRMLFDAMQVKPLEWIDPHPEQTSTQHKRSSKDSKKSGNTEKPQSFEKGAIDFLSKAALLLTNPASWAAMSQAEKQREREAIREQILKEVTSKEEENKEVYNQKIKELEERLSRMGAQEKKERLNDQKFVIKSTRYAAFVKWIAQEIINVSKCEQLEAGSELRAGAATSYRPGYDIHLPEPTHGF